MNHRDAEHTEGVPEEFNRWTGAIIGAAIEVHRHLGPGFLESVYEEAIVIELERLGLFFRRQVEIPVIYKGMPVGESRIDLLVQDEIVVELKAVAALLPIHRAQVMSYLKAGAFQLGLLINFNVPLLRDGILRVISTG
jgi:GxxExxY protein